MPKESESARWRVLLRADTLLLAVAVLAGGAGAVLSGHFLDARAAEATAQLHSRFQTLPVVVAAQDLSQGDRLDAVHLAVRQMPKEFLPADAVPPERASELLGAQASIAIRRGTPVVPAALRRSDDGLRLASTLADGRRALTIAVDQVNAQAGNLQPGDWVDLYYSRSAGGEAMLVPLLQHVEVLAAGAELQGDSGQQEFERSFGTITLGLSSADAIRVVLAQQAGSLSVVLRPPGDRSEFDTGLHSSRELLRQKREAPVPVPGRVELLVGGQGALVPEQSWLRVGDARSVGEGS